MAHVFTSYVRENQKEVDRLCGELTKHSINIWLDRNDIMPGTRWRQAIREALRRAMERIVEKSIDYIKQKIGISRGVLVWEPYKALSSKDSQIRICAAYSLANIDDLFAVPTPAAPILVKALRNEDFRVHKLDASAHKLATFALRKIGTPEALKAVEDYEKRKD